MYTLRHNVPYPVLHAISALAKSEEMWVSFHDGDQWLNESAVYTDQTDPYWAIRLDRSVGLLHVWKSETPPNKLGDDVIAFVDDEGRRIDDTFDFCCSKPDYDEETNEPIVDEEFLHAFGMGQTD